MLISYAPLLVLSIAVANAAPAFLHIAVAKGAPATVPNSFKVTASHNTNKVRNGTRAIHKAYSKYSLTPTRTMKSLITKRQDSSVSTTPTTDDAEYLCPVTIGGQKLMLDFDSGSSDLWVFSSSLSSSNKSGHSVFTANRSSTFEQLPGYTWDISYFDGSGASGTVGTDTVKIGNTTVTKQAVELATAVSPSFVTDTSDGIVGLAFNGINTVQPEQQKTFFDNAQANLASPVFTAYLPSEADGSYTFGTIDSSKFTGNLTYTAVDNTNGFWEYPSTSYKVGSTVHSDVDRTGVSDTGTTLVLVSDAAVDAYYAQVSSAKFDEDAEGYVFDCTADLPDFSVAIGSNYATIPGSLINFAPIDNSGETCFGAVQSVGEGLQNIYGDVFFNANYGIFNASGPSFGFAPLKSPTPAGLLGWFD